MQADNPALTPDAVLDTTDPGDEVQRRFRYQHGYGVILLAGALSQQPEMDYTEIWCENHDDIIGHNGAGSFDSYQVKTRAVGRPAWTLTDVEFIASLRKFCLQECRFPCVIRRFSYVTNGAFLNSTSQRDIARSPIQLRQAVAAVDTHAQLPEPHLTTFSRLHSNVANGDAAISCDTLFVVLTKLRLVRGPSLEDFEDAISSTHLARIPECTGMSVVRLTRLREELLRIVYVASSATVDDPAKHWVCIAAMDENDPRLRAKRIGVDSIRVLISDPQSPTFMFADPDHTLSLSSGSTFSVLEQKALRGGLEVFEIESLRQRALSAERHLLEESIANPDRFMNMLSQLQGEVQSICSDAQTEASAGDEPYGRDMYRVALARLRALADSTPEQVFAKPYNCLVGIAGLLTNECHVWWSPQFPVSRGAE